MCKCGCDKCETVSTALVLNESKAPMTILSEGLKHHMDANKPLTNNFYSAGSKDYFDLIAEARSLYSRGILDFTNKRDIELLTETDQGHFGMYEGKKVPLDFPIEIKEYSDENYDSLEDSIAQAEFGMDYDQLGPGEKEWVRDEIDNMSMNEVTRYSGFDRNPEDPDSIPFEPTGSVSEFKEDLRALFGKFKGDLKNPEFIKGVAQIMVNWKSLLRSQTELDEAKFKGKTVDLNKPTRGDSKKFKVYVNSGKKNADGSIKVKKVNFGHGGTTAKKSGQKTMSIRKSNPKARAAFRARHKCDNPGPKTMARYWSCKKW
jgi:hypothetical protein